MITVGNALILSSFAQKKYPTTPPSARPRPPSALGRRAERARAASAPLPLAGAGWLRVPPLIGQALVGICALARPHRGIASALGQKRLQSCPLPRSARLPAPTIRSASTTVDSLWAIISTVRPCPARPQTVLNVLLGLRVQGLVASSKAGSPGVFQQRAGQCPRVVFSPPDPISARARPPACHSLRQRTG